MGQRMAYTLAIFFMTKLGTSALKFRLLFYSRYIDYCFVIYANEAEMDKWIYCLNRQPERIKLTGEKPESNCHPI
ncbi:hypothetical protein RB195_006017 [Necator americanus]|uniref:PH domain-containing protein n=1 Tax=Necator americanus TaxID=51031 RepID=A0ABR1BTI9_NECAM